jgi:hypothetical protein
MDGMNHWLVVRLIKDAALGFAIIAAIVVIYRKFK